jgi:hypothetical protein
MSAGTPASPTITQIRKPAPDQVARTSSRESWHAAFRWDLFRVTLGYFLGGRQPKKYLQIGFSVVTKVTPHLAGGAFAGALKARLEWAGEAVSSVASAGP